MTEFDPELDAMSKAAAAISMIEDEVARARVVEWLAKRFGVYMHNTPLTHASIVEVGENPVDRTAFDLFSDLYDSANPTTDMARALVGGYWLQVQGQQQTWDSFSVNKILKDVGYGIGSISHRLTDAQNQKPALVRQTSKSGKTRQARKTYRLTQAGIKFVENLIGTGLVSEG